MANTNVPTSKASLSKGQTGRTGGRIPIAHGPTQRQQRFFFLTAILLFGISLVYVDLDFKLVSKGLERLPHIVGQMLQISFVNTAELAAELLTSVIVAFLCVVFSVIVSLILAFVVASNTAPNRLLAKLLSALFLIIRTIPTTIWVLLAVASLGFGPMAGVLGLLFPTSSYLIRTFASQIEEGGNEVIEAMSAVGATWWQIVLKGLFPTLYTAFLSTTAFRFELSVAESVILGMVGAGGIGFLLQSYISYYEFENLSLGILMVFTTSFLLEMITGRIRKKLGHR